MESLPPDFLQGHSQTPPCYLCFSLFQSLFLNPISAPLWPQSSLIGLYFSSGPPPSPRVTFQLLGTPSQVHKVLFQWYSGLCYK